MTDPILSLIEQDRILDVVTPPFIGTDLEGPAGSEGVFYRESPVLNRQKGKAWRPEIRNPGIL